ncbi:MAG: O-antigen ligase family protein [Planctomycetaceae bacterium]|nr:O-antigen ligase family protein [Planctomycetaceae bacterium]
MRALTLVLFGLALACPLVAVPGTGFDAYRLPVVLALAAALMGCAFVRSSRGGDRPPTPAPLRTAGFLLLGAQLVSLIGARSIAEGAAPVLTLAAGLAVYCGMKGGLLRKERATALLLVIPVVALGVGLVGQVQVLLNVEAVATEGNRNYAGALAAMLLVPATALTVAQKGLRRGLAFLGALASGMLLFRSESRGGFLAAVAGLLLAAVALRKVPGGIRNPAGAALLLVAAFGIGQGARQLSAERLETAQFRLEAWKSGLRMLSKRPVTGWGAGSFQTEYPPFRSEAEFRSSHGDGRDGYKEVEDPHSSWVTTAVETGALGLLGLLLVVYVAARLWRYYAARAADPETAAAVAGLGGGALAYLVAGSFNTLTIHVSHTVLFWAFLGLMEVLGDPREWRQGSRARELRVAVPAAAAVALLFGAFWTARTGVSDQAFVEGMSSADPKARELHLREAVDLQPRAWRAHYELARTLSLAGRHAGALEQSRETLRLRPYHVEALNLAAISILRTGGSGDEAERCFREAMMLAPWYYKSYYHLALLEGQRGHSGESRCYLSKALQHKPDHAASYYYRGLTFLGDGDAASAVADLRRARTLGFDVAAALRADRPAASGDPRYEEFFR